ncbi:hypothetical protein K491DRAFT_699069 [Lophiostoma macrostomum CBS 122681]|uniref:5'-3' DNA helicase ZGRF1-like N-terminal domain-containing protein n=1 Tax=Lophiostoma macrostomum CBS 122681 TaxID=1314788 RepID=A0A6A6SMM7_9PLEO|nr:hypothetical protein K491DRAFT_699069 [Lophiostoma macrostomum CBS 122681]
MTASVRGTPRLSAVPASQNTAPVAEFRCLFTHDIRRKQKRWQDGYLKFHTFNSRVMVYDTSRNFLGDTYWKDSNEVQEGDELTLDKGVMVEVAEAMGVTQTDLTPLFEKKSPQAKPAPTKLPPRPSITTTTALPRPGVQLRHKSLNTLLGTPKGPIGKSVPLRSPYEARKEKENEWADERAAKRQKTSRRPVVVQSSSPIRGGESGAKQDLPLWARTSDAKKAPTAPKIAPPPKAAPRPSTTINLDSDPERISSDVTLPSTPPAMQVARSRLPVTSAPAPVPVPAPAARPEPPQDNSVQTPVVPRRKIRLPRPRPVETPPRPLRSSSPPVSVSNRVSNVDFAIQPAKKQAARKLEKQPSPPPSPLPLPKAKATKSLRLSTGAKRGMLLCESLPAQRSRSTSVASADKPNKKRKTKPKEVVEPPAFEPIPWPEDEDVTAQLEEKLSDDEVVFVATKERRQSTATTAKRKNPTPFEVSPASSPEAFDDMELMHGLMDQELMPKDPSPARSPPLFKATSKKNVEAAPRSPSIAEPPTRPAPKPKKATKTPAPETVRSKAQLSHPVAPAQQSSKPTTPLPTHHPPLINAQPKTSTSPKIALSTGGLGRKKKKTLTTTSTTSVKPRAPILPPHPLTSNPNGPLMTTTELSHQLLRERPIGPDEDPIEDASQPGTAQTSSRGFRRVRSENDKDRPPEGCIPSSAAQWEARNLPTDKERGKDKGKDTGKAASGTSTDSISNSDTTKNTTTTKPGPEKGKGKAKVKSGLAALIQKTDPRKKFQRSQSLNLDTDIGRGGSVESDIPSPVLDTDVGPWSTEAFDLFDWRPPRRDKVGTGIGGRGRGEDGDGEGDGEVEDLGIGMLVDRK